MSDLVQDMNSGPAPMLALGSITSVHTMKSLASRRKISSLAWYGADMTKTLIYADELYTIYHSFGYELWYRSTLLFVSPEPADAYEYIAWRNAI